MPFRRFPEYDRTIDAGAGVPTGIRLIGVIRAHFDAVFADLGKRDQIDIEIEIAVRTRTCFFPVDEYLRLAINDFEFEKERAEKVLFGKRQRFGVGIIRPSNQPTFAPPEEDAPRGSRSMASSGMRTGIGGSSVG